MKGTFDKLDEYYSVYKSKGLQEFLADVFVRNPHLKEQWLTLPELTHSHLHAVEKKWLDFRYAPNTNTRLMEALQHCAWIRFKGHSVADFTFECQQLPDRNPTCYGEALAENAHLRCMTKSWKDLAAMVLDLAEKLKSALTSADKAQQDLNKATALAAWYRAKLQAVAPPSPATPLDPSPEDLKRLQFGDAKGVYLSSLAGVRGILAQDL